MPSIHYTIAMPRPASHRFQLTVEVQGWEQATATLRLPVWTPGSYLVREFARHVENIRAETLDGTPLPVLRSNKASWRIETATVSAFRVQYEVYANELTVRTSHLDETHGYFNGTNVFMFLEGFTEQPLTLDIQQPEGWHRSIALPQDEQGHYRAASYDQLVDSPAEIGTHRVLSFEVQGKAHEVALWGTGNEDEAALRRDLKQIVETIAGFFGGELPYARYLFIVHLGDGLGGGLEHRDSTTLAVSRWTFQPPGEYEKFLRLALHEYFHTWHVKRIRPHNLGPFDYTQEVYTPLLWVMEGFTTYYDLVLLRRAGLLSARRALELWGERLDQYWQQPGRLVQSLEESSLTTWIKFYRQDENYINSGISYYLKGSLVALWLDMALRHASGNATSLDTLMLLLWEQYGQRDIGFTPDEFLDAVQGIGGPTLREQLQHWVQSVEELPLDEALAWAGLEVTREQKADSPTVGLGLRLKKGEPGLLVQHVLRDSPAEAAGLMPHDRLIALDGFEIKDEGFLTARLKEKAAGEHIVLHLFRYGALLEKHVTLAGSPEKVALRPLDAASPLQQRIGRAWLQSE